MPFKIREKPNSGNEPTAARSSLRSDDSSRAMPRRKGHSPMIFFYFLPALVRWGGESKVHGGGRHVGVFETCSSVENHHFFLRRKPSARDQVIVGRRGCRSFRRKKKPFMTGPIKQ